MDKKTLRQYRSLLKEIEQLEEEKANLYHLPAMKITDMPKAHKQNDLSNVAVRLDKLQKMIDATLDKIIDLREKIENSIDQLPANERLLIRLRYIEGKRWEQIAVELHYSIQRTWQIHGGVLKKFRDY